jgi:hypothetical protein
VPLSPCARLFWWLIHGNASHPHASCWIRNVTLATRFEIAHDLSDAWKHLYCVPNSPDLKNITLTLLRSFHLTVDQHRSASTLPSQFHYTTEIHPPEYLQCLSPPPPAISMPLMESLMISCVGRVLHQHQYWCFRWTTPSYAEIYLDSRDWF